MHQNGYQFNALVNNADFFTGCIYSDGGSSYWGTVLQRGYGIDNCKLYKYFAANNTDSVAVCG